MSLRGCLKKSCLSLFVAGLVLVSINMSGAQVLSAVPGIGNVDFGSVRVFPVVQAGYKNIGFSFSLPFSVTPNHFIVPPVLDLQFRDAGVWVGSIGLDTSLPSALFLNLRADANATKNISIFTGENFPYFSTSPPYTWSASGLQWWDVDGMVGYALYKDWSIVGGLRYDKVTVSLENPVDGTGTLVSHPPVITHISQDVIVKTWIPYIGFELDGPNYSASLVFSPRASSEVNTPNSITAAYVSSIAGDSWTNNVEFNYKFANNGSFLEGFFEYNAPVLNNLQLGLWTRGTWMRFSGTGDWNLANYAVNTQPFVANPQGSTGTLNTRSLGGGLSASLFF